MKREPSLLPAKRRGTLLIIVLVLLLVTSSIAAAILNVSLLNARQFTATRNIMQADRLSEAGLAIAASKLATDPRYQGEIWTTELPASKGVVEIKIERSQGMQNIVSTASFPVDSKTPARSTRVLEIQAPADL